MGVLEPTVGQDGDAHDQQHEPVEVERIDEIGIRIDPEGLQERREEDGRAVDGRDALGAVGEVDRLVQVVGEDTDHLAEAESHQRQVVAVEPQDR